MMRKLSFFAMLLLACAVARAANPSVTIGSLNTATVDENIEIRVTASGFTRLTDWNLRLAYDRDSLSFVRVDKGAATTSWFYVDGSGYKGKLQLIGRNGSSGTPVAGDNQELCRIWFRTKPDAYTTTVTLMPSSPGGEIRNAALTPGKVTIVSLPPLKLSLGSGKAPAGANVTVAAVATGMSGSTAWGFDVSFDRKKLNFISVAKGAAVKNWSNLTGRIVDGKLRIEASSGGSAIGGTNLELCQITFGIVPGTKTNSSLDLKLGRCTLGLNGAKKSNGKIKVAAPVAKKKP